MDGEDIRRWILRWRGRTERLDTLAAFSTAGTDSDRWLFIDLAEFLTSEYKSPHLLLIPPFFVLLVLLTYHTTKRI